MKKRWLVGLAVFVLAAALLLPQLSADIHYFFTRQTDRLTLNPMEGWTAVLSGGNALWFYLLLSAVVALILAWILFTGSYLNYRSDMQEVTPDIITPCADGQGQFGTARWLGAEKYGKAFSVWKLPEKDASMKALLKAGQEDKKEVQRANLG